MILRRLGTATAVASFAFGLLVAALAWYGRERTQLWHFRTPSRWAFANVSPRSCAIGVWKRADWDPVIGNGTGWVGPFQLVHDDDSDTVDGQWTMLQVELTDADASWTWRSVGWLRGSKSGKPIPSYSKLWLPTWLVLLPCVFPFSLFFITRLWQYRRRRDGLCRKCGYDLRASPTRCPECGSISRNTDSDATV